MIIKIAPIRHIPAPLSAIAPKRYFMHELKLVNNETDKLVLKKSKLEYSLRSILLLIGIIIIFFEIISKSNNSIIGKYFPNYVNVILISIFCAILLSVLIKYILIAIKGDNFIFDYNNQILYHNKKIITDFKQIDCFKLSYEMDSEEYLYKLKLLLKNNKKINVGSSYDKIEILNITNILSKKTNIRIEFENNWRKST